MSRLKTPADSHKTNAGCYLPGAGPYSAIAPTAETFNQDVKARRRTGYARPPGPASRLALWRDLRASVIFSSVSLSLSIASPALAAGAPLLSIASPALAAGAAAVDEAPTSPSATQPSDPILTPEAVEQRLTEKLRDRLDLILEPTDYRVLATAKVKNSRERVQVEGEMQSQSSGQEAQAPTAELLPGFQQLETPKPVAKDVGRKERSRFTFRNKSELQSVAVHLILAKHLDQATKDLATSAAKEVVELTAGNAARFEMTELDIGKPPPPAESITWWGWVKAYLERRGGSAIDLLYLSLLLVSIVGAVFALRRTVKSKKEAAGPGLPRGAGGEGLSQRDQDQAVCEQKLDGMIGMLTSSPLLTRAFLQQLGNEDKQALLSGVRTPALRGYFSRVLGPGAEGGTDASATRAAFERILKDLERYVRLGDDAAAKPFGYIAQMTGAQLAPALLAETDRLSALAIVGPYLGEGHVKELAKRLTVDEKAAFIGMTRGNHQAPTADPERQRLDARLRERFLAARHEAIADATDLRALESTLLDADSDAVSVVKRLAAIHGTMPRGYEKYLVDFEHLLGLDLGIGRRVFQRVSNETLARALADWPDDPRIAALLGDIRFQLVDSLRHRGEKVTAMDVVEAQNEIIRHYRSVV